MFLTEMSYCQTAMTSLYNGEQSWDAHHTSQSVLKSCLWFNMEVPLIHRRKQSGKNKKTTKVTWWLLPLYSLMSQLREKKVNPHTGLGSTKTHRFHRLSCTKWLMFWNLVHIKTWYILSLSNWVPRYITKAYSFIPIGYCTTGQSDRPRATNATL